MSSEDYLNKSPSQEPKDPESLKKSQDSSSTSSSSNSQDNQEFIQDYVLFDDNADNSNQNIFELK